MTAQQSTALREVDAPFYRYWQALGASFYDSALYVDVGKRWKGFSLGYLLLLMFIVLLPFSLRVMTDLNTWFDQKIVAPISQLPTLYIQNGEVSLDKPMPYFVKNSKGAVQAIVDTSGKIMAITKEFPELTILVTKNKLIYRALQPTVFFDSAPQGPARGTIFIQDIPKDLNQVFNGNDWVKTSGIKSLKILGLFIIYPTLALVFFSMALVMCLAMAMMGQLVAQIFFKFPLTYLQAFRLLMVAATPQLVFLVAILTGHWLFFGSGIILFALLGAYFGFAVLSLKRAGNKLVMT